MKRLLAVAVLLISCKDRTDPTAAVPDAAAIVFDASAAPAAPPSKYRYWNQNDPLGRYMIVVPMTFTKTEKRSCTKSDCFDELDFAGDGLAVRAYATTASEERHTLDEDKRALAASKETVTSETKLEGGWSITTTADEGRSYVFHHQISTFISPIRFEVRGPMDRKADIDEIGQRLAKESLGAHIKPPRYCRDLPWTPPSARKQTQQTWLGRMEVATENGREGDKPFVLVLDEPVCGQNGRAVWEIQAISTGKPDLARSIGKHVRGEGYFDVGQGSKEIRPIVSALSLVTIEPIEDGG